MSICFTKNPAEFAERKMTMNHPHFIITKTEKTTSNTVYYTHMSNGLPEWSYSMDCAKVFSNIQNAEKAYSDISVFTGGTNYHIDIKAV